MRKKNEKETRFFLLFVVAGVVDVVVKYLSVFENTISFQKLLTYVCIPTLL